MTQDELYKYCFERFKKWAVKYSNVRKEFSEDIAQDLCIICLDSIYNYQSEIKNLDAYLFAVCFRRNIPRVIKKQKYFDDRIIYDEDLLYSWSGYGDVADNAAQVDTSKELILMDIDKCINSYKFPKWFKNTSTSKRMAKRYIRDTEQYCKRFDRVFARFCVDKIIGLRDFTILGR